MERICRDLLKLKIKRSKYETKDGKDNIMVKYYSKNVHPHPGTEGLPEGSQIMGIRVSLRKVSYAVLSDEGLVRWGSLPVFTQVSSKSQYEHTNLFSLCQDLVERLPPADYYVQEDLLTILPNDPYVKLKINLVKLRSYLMCTLTSRSVLGMNNIYTLKPAILDSLFTLKMGSDRLSMQDKLWNMINEKSETPNLYNIKISEDMLSILYDKEEGGEPLAGALLQAVAFKHIVQTLKQKTES
ncbi:uncharacterized protein LOC111706794 [Eurytemora carolleeae]|uniref:uncharacterized protein LOC111706794 n=1 Tax=Eurytemora carolleeae TaxID=1294199 RepID=UPI000C7569EA|nr:uncharacterized protein LOC111706794 [Eurytemora carolleeae]|eukprot:XP_023335501.1 uncharacterized protein LOC111706794 [Eurytemora affinis]